MTKLNKDSINSKLQAYVARYDSQNKAAASLKGVSSGTISQIVNDKWELISDQMWRKIASQIGYAAEKWTGVETRTFKLFSTILSDAQSNSNVFAVCADAGSGKTFTAKYYAQHNERSYLLHCNEYWNRKLFMSELLRTMGKDSGGLTVGEMMGQIVSILKRSEQPLIILDEADKLSDQLLFFFITLYNLLEDHCGIVMCGTDYLQKRIVKGVSLNKRGYKEIFSRIGRRFVELKPNTKADIKGICTANGIDDDLKITEIVNEAEGDLRRVKRKIHAFRQMEA